MGGIQDIRVHAPVVVAEGACFMIACTFMVGLRFYARRLSASRLSWDDFASLSALVFVLALCITNIIEVAQKGLGYPASVGDAGAGHPDANVAGWPTELIQIPALASIKLSFLLLYRRIFTVRVARQFSIMNWFMIGIIVAWMIGFFFSLLFLCGTNFAAYWISSETEQTECLPTAGWHLGYAISDVITDFIVILLPIPEIWKLNLPTRRKWAVTGVFALGALTIAMSVIRMVIYQQALSVQFDPDSDFEYITTLTSYFSLLEAGFGLIASCMPVQYGLLRSEKVRDIFRTIYSIGSRGSRGSRGSDHSRRSGHSNRATTHRDRIEMPTKTAQSSQGSDTNINLNGMAGSYYEGESGVELGDMPVYPQQGAVVVTKSFRTDEERRVRAQEHV